MVFTIVILLNILIFCYFAMMLTDNCNPGEVRRPLLGGASEREGIVEVCVDGNYLLVSLDNGRFSVREATVICKQLGLGNGECRVGSHN